MVELRLTAAKACLFNPRSDGLGSRRFRFDGWEAVTPWRIYLTATLKDGRLRGFFAT